MPENQYRVLRLIHLGGIEPPTQLNINEVVGFEGNTLTRENGEVLTVPQPDGIRGALKVGWIVPVESAETSFTPKAAGVEVRQALASGEKRERLGMMTVADEERNLGSISQVRPDGAPATHVAGKAGTLSETSDPAPMKRKVEVRNSDDGVVVGRMKLSASADPVEIGKGDDKIRNQLDNGSAVGVEKVARATGDVQEARTGEILEDLLPDAASAGVPAPGLFKDEDVEVGRGASSVGGAESGTEIAKIGASKHRAAPKDPEAALRTWSATGQSWDDQPVTLADVKVLLRVVLRKIDVLRPLAEANVRAEQALTEDSSNGEIIWDSSLHWKVRSKNLKQYQGNAAALKAILPQEPSDAVKRIAQGFLDALA